MQFWYGAVLALAALGSSTQERAAADLEQQCEQGIAALEQGAFSDAARQLSAAMESGLPESDDWALDCRLRYADALANLNQPGEAESILRETRALAEAAAISGIAFDSLNQLVTVLTESGRLGEAEVLGQETLDLILADSSATASHLAKARVNLMSILVYQGRYEEAIASYSDLPAFVDEAIGPEDPLAIVTRSVLAAAHGMNFDYDRSIQLYEELAPASAATLGEEDRDHLIVLNNLASLYLQTGRFDEAESRFEEVLAIRLRTLGETHFDTTVSYENIARLHMARGDYDRAEPIVMRLIALRRAILGPTHRNLATSWFLLGEYFDASGAPAESRIFAYKQGIGVLQEIQANMQELPEASRSSFASAWIRAYETLQEWLIEEGRFAEAEEIGNMYKTAEYVGFVRGEGDFPRPEQPPMTGRESEWSEEFASWMERPNLAAARLREAQAAGDADPDELAALQQAYDEAYASYRLSVGEWLTGLRTLEDDEVREEGQALGLAQSDRMQAMVAELGDDVALLQIAALPDAVHLFLITPDAFVHRSTSIERGELFSQLFELRQAIIDGGRLGLANDPDHIAEMQIYAGDLYQALVAPVAQDLEDAGTSVLMLNLQGQLRYLPFAALHDGESWLIEDFSLALWSPAAPSRFDGFTSIARGRGYGASQPIEGFSPLPAVPRELEAVLTGNDESGPLAGEFVLDAEFTLERLEAGLSEPEPVLHIASHFSMNAGEAGESFLLLGDGSRLTLSEINLSPRMRFNGVELVTLSACETGLSGEGSGLEIDGLGALIQNKGADSVLATLWSVADDTTADFMIEFYAGMASGDLDKARSLRQAQLRLINSPDAFDPFFWAPFVLMGDWK